MKRFLTVALIIFIILSLTACGADGGEDIKTDAGNDTGVTDKAPESGDVQTAPEKNYPDNIMINPYGTGGYVLFNRDIKSSSIRTVTFLDTLVDMPSDAWDVSEAKNGSVMAWVTESNDLYIAGEGGVTASSCNRMFGGYKNAVSIDFGGCFYTDLTDRITEMFVYCESLETLDLSGWNTSNVRYMSDAFHGCTDLKTLDLSGWDTSNVETMRCMFEDCFKLQNVDVSHFDTSKVASFINTFAYCKDLRSIDLSSWDTSSARSMEGMFKNCESLEDVGDLKVPEGCDTTDMYKGTKIK